MSMTPLTMREDREIAEMLRSVTGDLDPHAMPILSRLLAEAAARIERFDRMQRLRQLQASPANEYGAKGPSTEYGR